MAIEAIEAVSFRRIATIEQLPAGIHTHTYTHGHLYRIPRAATPRGIIIMIIESTAGADASVEALKLYNMKLLTAYSSLLYLLCYSYTCSSSL